MSTDKIENNSYIHRKLWMGIHFRKLFFIHIKKEE